MTDVNKVQEPTLIIITFLKKKKNIFTRSWDISKIQHPPKKIHPLFSLTALFLRMIWPQLSGIHFEVSELIDEKLSESTEISVKYNKNLQWAGTSFLASKQAIP